MLRQSCLSHAKAPSSLWHGFSCLHLQSLLVFVFLSFHLEDIFYYSHPQDGKTSDSPASFRPISLTFCVSKLFDASYYSVYSSFWSLIPFSLAARPVSALDGLHLIQFCTFLSPFRMGLTSPGQTLGRFCLLLISRKLLTLSGIRPFSTNLFRLASLLALLVGLDLSFLTDALAWFIKITKAAPSKSVEVLHKDPFFTKLERLHRAASRAITGCLSSSFIPLLLTKASLPLLRVTLTHFTLLF